MHICHLTLGHSPYDDRIYYKELWSLRGWADTISLIAREVSEPEISYSDIQVVPFPLKSLRKNLVRICNLAVELQADLYHLHEAELLMLAPWLRRRTNAAIVYDMHEPLPEVIRDFSPASYPKRMLVSFLLGALEHIGLPLVDGVVFTARPLAQQMRWATRDHAIIYNFPRRDIFNRPDPEIAQDDFTVLYQGQIAPARGISELITGFGKFYQREKAGKLRIIGRYDPPEYESELRCRISDQNLEPVVVLNDPVPHSQMPQVLARASVGIMALFPTPAFRKSVQGKTFEYLASGLPVIAGNYPSAHQFLGENRAGIILEETTPSNIAAAIEKLYANPKLRNKMSENGIRAVESHLNWSRMQEELHKFYTRIFAKKRG
ncbi:MAG: glycosyltransferase [Candidatus Marinimicrobia bacterium]|nr:glycosyltransferase [Candidatus Neomarinimicrobiota bacterium]MCF7827907.1 glycosyltransferase [Candidatus Neomarinimicrobiota bacterium]MCF7879338.1 glycosyltransferase [Candidatus Neomarinimicrobiota bacterium]